MAPFENGGFEGKVGNDDGEIRGVTIRKLRGEVEILAGLDGGTVEGVAGGDDDRVCHDGT